MAYYGAGDHHVMVARAPVKKCLEYMICPKNRVNDSSIDKKIIMMGSSRRQIDEAA